MPSRHGGESSRGWFMARDKVRAIARVLHKVEQDAKVSRAEMRPEWAARVPPYPSLRLGRRQPVGVVLFISPPFGGGGVACPCQAMGRGLP